MGIKQFSVLFISLVVLMTAAVTTAVGMMTYFSYTETANHHISTGSLEVEFTRTELSGYRISKSTGFMEEYNNTDLVNLASSGQKIININNAYPTMYQTATLSVTNTGDVDMDYAVSVVAVEAETPQSVALLDQIQIYVYNSDDVLIETFRLSSVVDSVSGQRVLKIGEGVVLSGGESDTFKIKAEFLDDDVTEGIDNDDAQNGDVAFDLQLNAVQHVR